MKKELFKVADQMGFELRNFRYERPEFSSVGYYAHVYKDGKLIKLWDGGYFVGEIGTANSKESLIPDFIDFLNELK